MNTRYKGHLIEILIDEEQSKLKIRVFKGSGVHCKLVKSRQVPIEVMARLVEEEKAWIDSRGA